jgi:hypothetical protein
VRGQGDEGRLHLVGALEGEPGLALADEEPRAVESERGEVAERAQQLDLVCAEVRRVRAGPDDERPVGHVEPENGRVVVVERVEHRGRCPMAAEDAALVIEEEGGARAHEPRHRREHVGHDLVGRREPDEVRDRFPPALSLLAPPDDAHDARRPEPE